MIDAFDIGRLVRIGRIGGKPIAQDKIGGLSARRHRWSTRGQGRKAEAQRRHLEQRSHCHEVNNITIAVTL
jgi:hypothetical protein